MCKLSSRCALSKCFSSSGTVNVITTTPNIRDGNVREWNYSAKYRTTPTTYSLDHSTVSLSSPDNIRVMMTVCRLRGNVIRTAVCWIVWHNDYRQQHTYMSSSYRSNRWGLSHWDHYAVRRDGCLELYYCNMEEWLWWDSYLISMTNWFPSVLWHCWFGNLACKNRPRNDL